MVKSIEKELINSPKTIQELFMILQETVTVKHILKKGRWSSKVPPVLPLHIMEKSIQGKKFQMKT